MTPMGRDAFAAAGAFGKTLKAALELIRQGEALVEISDAIHDTLSSKP